MTNNVLTENTVYLSFQADGLSAFNSRATAVNAVLTGQREGLSVGVDGFERAEHIKLSIFEVF